MFRFGQHVRYTSFWPDILFQLFFFQRESSSNNQLFCQYLTVTNPFIGKWIYSKQSNLFVFIPEQSSSSFFVTNFSRHPLRHYHINVEKVSFFSPFLHFNQFQLLTKWLFLSTNFFLPPFTKQNPQYET